VKVCGASLLTPPTAQTTKTSVSNQYAWVRHSRSKSNGSCRLPIFRNAKEKATGRINQAFKPTNIATTMR
jgi:hypothetical protein